jgi:hypothetical protein
MLIRFSSRPLSALTGGATPVPEPRTTQILSRLMRNGHFQDCPNLSCLFPLHAKRWFLLRRKIAFSAQMNHLTNSLFCVFCVLPKWFCFLATFLPHLCPDSILLIITDMQLKGYWGGFFSCFTNFYWLAYWFYWEVHVEAHNRVNFTVMFMYELIIVDKSVIVY